MRVEGSVPTLSLVRQAPRSIYKLSIDVQERNVKKQGKSGLFLFTFIVRIINIKRLLS